MTDVEMLKKAIEKAGLTKAEAATIMGITRNTLYRWLTGKNIRYKLSEQFAVFQAKKLMKAVDAGLLPLPPGRVNKITEVSEILKGL